MNTSADTRYNAEFYMNQRSGSATSAAEVVPIVLELVNPQSVVDVGCGIGTWTAAFYEHGVRDFVGIDGAYVDHKLLIIPEERFTVKDLNQPFSLNRRFDLAVSLEVAEHLEPKNSSPFVQSLTALSDMVLFSAAIPGQHGTGHINEQWPDFWVDIFKEQGFTVVDCLRDRIWRNCDIEPWYRQNLLLFVKSEHLEAFPRLKELAARDSGRAVSLVHPEIYWARGPGMNLLVLARQISTTLRLAYGRNLERLRALVKR
jgi:SAM-dependent methyltransferase